MKRPTDELEEQNLRRAPTVKAEFEEQQKQTPETVAESQRSPCGQQADFAPSVPSPAPTASPAYASSVASSAEKVLTQKDTEDIGEALKGKNALGGRFGSLQ